MESKIFRKKIISFSGIDGSGKGTQINLLESFLFDRKIKYKTIWARGSWTPGIELIKKIVRKDHGFSEKDKELYRQEARNNPKKQKIILILSILDLIWYFGVYYRLIILSGKILICDRYIWDTLIDFRVNFSGVSFEDWTIWRLLLKVLPKPDSSIVFIISAEESIKRGLIKKEAHMENFPIKRAKTEEYYKLISEGKWSHIIDGIQDIKAIHLSILKSIDYENR